MRTRLDEIVEEISGKTPDTNWDYWSPYAVEVFGKIAEACFRHGVERVSEQLLKQPGSLYVQPAQAGEEYVNCGTCRAPNCWCRRRRTPRAYGTTYHGDERKGERRKGLEVTRRDTYFGGLWWPRGGDVLDIRKDSRSGNDRRGFRRCPGYHCYQPIGHGGPCPKVPSK